ncbi:ESPR-type extended signal peptide-containing protein [Acidaminococcus fermentans]|uniref:ESPR-type extended signal peptide-containing protein n=1 Tax=Acidaminococcus fermentans TaxID=905 RepID=UPI00241CCBC6|nr:ESPR-type extended signal peptide-containing protein [Acidaminococcus fermentans]
MNRIFKVIFNRNRQLVQVVPEYAKNRGKEVSESRKGGVRGLAKVLLTFLATLMIASPGYAADGNSTGSGDTTAATTDTAKQVVVAQGDRITVTPSTDTTNNTITYTISAKNDGKIETGNTDLVSGGTVYTALNGLQTTIGSLTTNGNYIKKDATVSSNLSDLDTQVKNNADSITKNANAISAETQARTDADTSLTNKIGTLDANGNYIQKDASVTSNLSTLDTQVKTNADAVSKEKKDRETAVTEVSNTINSLSDSVVKYDAGSNKTTVTLAGENGTTITNIKDGTLSDSSMDAVTGKQLYAEQTARESADTTLTNKIGSLDVDKYYIKKDASVSTNLTALDTNLKNVIDAIGLDSDDTTTSYTSKLNKYFKVNPEITTDANGTKTYAADAAAGGTNSVAIGPSASVDTASNAMALGTGATVNQTATSGVAIGKGAVTGSADKTITVNNLSYAVKAAGGENSVAIGTDASSAGKTSLALGKGATVENDSDGSYQAVVKSDDIAIGTDAKTSASDFSTAIGKGSSVTQSTDALAVGSGAKVTTSKNAMAFGKGADAESAADSIAMGTSAKTISADTIAIGQSTSATGANSVVIGKGATTTSEGGNAIGSRSTASGNSTAIGQSATANNYNAVAIGNGATANADKSIALGYQAGVGTSEGKGEPQNAGSLIAIGTSAGNNVSGMQNVAIGESAGSNVKSSNNIAIGTQAGYGINYASDDKAQNGYNVSIGYKANYQENAANIMYATALGNEANASNYAVAIGDGAKASGTNSLALGYSAQASDAESMALGHNASAADGNIAIGDGSSAPSVSTLGTVKAVTVDGKTINYVYDANNNQFKSAFTYKPLQADSHYISVGSSTLTRRISNVADGVFASDAATVGQLNSLNELLQATDTKVGLTKDYFEQKFTNLNTTIDASKTHYFSISESSDNLSANKDNTGATSNKADAMAIGPNANATNVKSLAVGNNVYATGLRSIAIGTAPNPTKDAAGTTTTHNTSAEGENSIALGTSTTAQADNSVAIGTRAQAYTTDTDSGKTGARSVAIGNLATTAGNQSVALGYDATVKYDYGMAIGSEALASGTDAVAVGKGNKAYSTDSTAIGQDNTVTGSNVYGLGSSNALSGNWGSIVQSGVSGYQNAVTSVSDQDTTNELTGVYMTGSSNTLKQDVKYNVMQDVTVQGSSNTIDGGAGGTSGHPNTLSQIAIVGSGNTVQGKSSDDSKTNNIKDVTILGYNNKVDANTDTTVDFSNTQILGSNVTAKLGNSVYLGSNAAYTGQTTAASDAITSARTAADAAAEASDAYKAATTDAEKAQIKAQYEAQYLYQLNVQAMEASGTTAGTQSYSTDETYGDGTRYTYAGSNPTGVITVGKAGSERRIQNVAAGLVSATSTDAVNGSQLYALTRQIRFGGDNSSFGTTTADDQNVVARGSNETLNIIGGEKDTTKLTDNNLGVVSDGKDTLTVKLSKNVNLGNDGSVAAGNTTLDTNGITITNGPKFTSSSIDAASQKITSVKAGEADNDAANVGQVKSARTLLTQGTNTQLADTEANGHHTYVVNVDNLAVKANGTGNTTVELANGINFVNGTNTTAAVGTDGTVTISATHNKLSTASAAPTGTNDDVTLTLTDADGNTVTSTGLKNTYTTVTKDGTAHTVTFARNDGITQTLSLGDLDGASKGELATTAAKATSEVTKGTNVTSVTKTTGNNGQNIYTVNVDDLAVKTTSGEKKSVHLADGLVFADGTNTTATVGDNGTIKFNVSDAAIKKQAVQAINVESGSNVTVTPVTNADGTLKTFTVAASDLKYSANGISRTTSLANGISFGTGMNTTAEIDNNGAIKINATHNKLNATGTATKATADSNAVTLTLQDADGNTTTTGLTDTYTTVSKDATNKKVTFKRNDGETQTLELSDLGGITAAQDKYVTGGKVTYNDKGDGTAALTGNNGLAASITGLKDTKVSSGTASYVGTQGDASGSATLKMNDGTTATISGLKDDYITSASVGTENNHVTMTRLGGGTVDLDLNPILGKYSLSDYHLVGAGTNHDQAYAVDSNGTVTLNVVDDKNPNGTPKTIQITGLASQSGVNAGRTTVKSSDSSVIVNDGTSNSNTHTYDIKVDYSKIPANLTVKYSGDNGTSGSNTMNQTTAFSGTANQIVTTAENGKVSFKLADNISGIQSVTTGDAKLNTDGLTITGGPSVLKTGINAGGKIISNVANAEVDTDAATLGQVKNARTVVAAGSNVASVTPSEGANNQMTYTVNVDNLSVKANNEAAKSVMLKKGLTFNNGTNTTASVGDNGEVKYDLNSTLTGLTSVTAGNSTLDNSGLTIAGGPKFTKNGIDAGSQKITGVANGENANDAVNKGQLDALQNQVSGGWNLSGKNSDGTAVTAQIGAGKTVTYADGTYTKSVVTKDDSTGNAAVKVDVTTGTFGSGIGDNAGTVTSTANGLATTQDVAGAINSASINVVADNTPNNKTSVKAGDTIHFAKDGNLTLVQNGTTFTYGLNPEINISKVTTSDATKGSTVQDAKGITTTDAAGNTYIQNGQGITLTSSDKTKSPVKLTNTGLNNGGNKITGVGKGTDDADAVNVAQLKEVNDKVGSGWQLAGNDGQKVADIGAGKKVSFKTGSQYLTANTESAGTDAANVTYGLKTKALTAADGKVSAVDTAEDGLATAKNVAETINQTYWTAASGKSGSGSQTDETANVADKQISAGDTVTFNAGNNLSLVQNGASFTYGLQADLTGMNTITFTPKNDADGHPISLVIGKQKDGVSTDEGYYITGLDNTTWNQSNYVKNRAATEAQLASAIQQVTLASQSGGFKLSDDNNNEVSQVLGQAIGVVGDSNITTTAETTTADPNGHIKVSLNKHIDLGTDGSLQAGGVTLKNNRVTVGNNGIVISSSDSERTVSNLSNTTWETAKVNQEASAGGYKGSTKAATESQLAEAISTATSTASANEQHIKAGSYSVTAIDNGDGTKSQGVSIDIVTGDGSKPEVVKGKVVIKDVAKASDVGDVSKLHDTLKNPDGTKNVTGAINNLDDRVTGLDTRMNDIYTTAGQHSSVSSESNIVVDHSAKNESGGTDYKLSLNREKIDLDKVTIEGKSGAVTAKTVTAEEYKVGNKTYISSDGLNANSQKITNVQAGTVDTDAANVGQVREADEQLAGGIAQNARNISQLGREVDKLDSRIDRVGAGAAALAALHPGAYDPNDKVDFSAGYGNYRGASAAAVGMYYHPDERTILSMGVAMGGGENMVNAGVTWKLGRRTPAAPQPVPVKAAPGAPALVPVSTAAAAPVRPVETAPAVRPVAVRTSVRPVEMVAPVAPAARVRPVQPAVAPVRTADTNAQLMELLARQTAILEKLSEQKAVPAAAPAASGDDLFTDVPENHWAYECALKMEKAGVLKGLGGLQVEGNPLLTRKDFARILYTALKNGATTNPALNSDNSLNRMASEFRGELKMVKG